jgi:DNA (cytosine-5)-methyltransferase 1
MAEVLPTVIDMFAGAGGLSLGLGQSGMNIQWAVESDIWAAQTYAANHPSVRLTISDITALTEDDMRCMSGLSDVDLIAGGPPCQGFSHSNVVRRDPKDPRNSLFRDFIRAVEVFKPKLCLLENVRGLLTSRDASGRRAIDIILREFEIAGYNADFRVLDAVEYGVPQRRERLFIVAVKSDIAMPFQWPAASHHVSPGGPRIDTLFGGEILPATSLWDAIGDLPQIYESAAALDYPSPPLNEYQKKMRTGATQISNHEPMRHTARIRARFASIQYGQSEADVTDEHSVRRRGDNAKLGRTYSQNSRRQRPDYPCSTVVASSHTNFIHPFLDRNFTVRELARIQSFPDWFRFMGKRAVLSRKLSERKGYFDDLYLDQRAQVGYAVPPLLAQALGTSLRNFLADGPEERADAV